MQAKLHRWVGADQGFRFDDLYNLVCEPATLQEAWDRVAGNKGARTAELDRYTVRDVIERVGVEAFLADICDQFRRPAFHPLSARERTIPKYRGKLRRLGIPAAAVRDRAASAMSSISHVPDVLQIGYRSSIRLKSHGASRGTAIRQCRL